MGNYLARRVDKRGGRLPGRGGYSDGELARLGDAARADVAAIRDRIDAGAVQRLACASLSAIMKFPRLVGLAIR